MRNTIFIACLVLVSGCIGTGTTPAAEPACPQTGTWLRLPPEGPPVDVPPAEIIAAMARRDVVLLGEQHDDADHHRWQLHTLAALHAHHPRMVIGFEMFPRRAQPVLDQWVAGELTAEEFLRQSNWAEVWRYPPELYLPLFEFARIHRVPMVALNVDRKLTAEIARRGWDGVTVDLREGISRPAPASAAYREFLFRVWGEHGRPDRGHADKPDESSAAFRNFVDAQLTWDRSMAQALADRVKPASGGGRLLGVGVLGASHARHGYGVPHQLRSLGVESVGVLLPVDARNGCNELVAGLADAVFVLAERRAAKPRPPRLGVRLAQGSSGVTLEEVMAGSLAERTGLRKGDVIARVAGRPLSRIRDLIETVNGQPGGTWLPVTVTRDGHTLELVVKFPPERAARDAAGP